MSDKSPRQTMTKKTGKSLKEKRATKRGKTERPRRPRPCCIPRKSEAAEPFREVFCVTRWPGMYLNYIHLKERS